MASFLMHLRSFKVNAHNGNVLFVCLFVFFFLGGGPKISIFFVGLKYLIFCFW